MNHSVSVSLAASAKFSFNKLFVQIHSCNYFGAQSASCWIHGAENRGTCFGSVLNCATGLAYLSSGTMEFIIHPHRLISLLSPTPPATLSVVLIAHRSCQYVRIQKRDRRASATQYTTSQPGVSKCTLQFGAAVMKLCPKPNNSI